MDICKNTRSYKQKCLDKGFTLIELLMTLAIAAILVTSSTSIFNLIQRNELTTITNTLVADMSFARSEAIKSGTEVVICISEDGQNCSKGDHWHNGWIIYHDLDGDRHRDDNEASKRRKNALKSTTTVTYNGRPVDNYIRFRSNGTTNYNGTFSICNSSNDQIKRALILSNTGRLRSSSVLANGKTINCLN